MTNQEAIKHLKFVKDGYQNLIDNDVRTGEAIGNDIKAEWESEKTMAEVYMKMIISLDMAIEALEKQSQWICTRFGQPSHMGEYLVNLLNNTIRVDYWDGNNWLEFPNTAVLAWMPLPDRYAKWGWEEE